MTTKQRDRQIRHWRNVIKHYNNKPFCTEADRQQRWYAESRIEEICEEWRLSEMKEFEECKKRQEIKQLYEQGYKI